METPVKPTKAANKKDKRKNPFMDMLMEQREATATVKEGRPLTEAQKARLVQPI